MQTHNDSGNVNLSNPSVDEAVGIHPIMQSFKDSVRRKFKEKLKLEKRMKYLLD